MAQKRYENIHHLLHVQEREGTDVLEKSLCALHETPRETPTAKILQTTITSCGLGSTDVISISLGVAVGALSLGSSDVLVSF